MNISEKIQLLTQDASIVETAKADIKQAIIDKGVDLTNVPFTDYHLKIGEISGGGETPTDGNYLVRFIDYDGTILKEEWVDSGEDATPPDLPDYTVATNKRPALTFQEWNNSYTNITKNTDIGATYIPTDEKTHAYVRLTVISGKDLSLYLSKTYTGTLSIDWGDNITTTHTDNGNFNTSHTYSDYGDYEIKIWISSGSGSYGFGGGSDSTIFVGGALQTQRNMLMSLFVGNNVSIIRSYAFYQCYSLTSISLPANVSSIGDYAFHYCYSLTSINIPANVSSIGASAFNQCYSLTSIVIPESVSYIWGSAFRNCYSLTSINIPANVSSIGASAFRDCRSLTSIVIPANVSSIPSYAFYQCYSLTSISIPANVSSIGTDAFTDCFSILKYVFNRTTPPDLANINAFSNINNIAKIYVPDESIDDYKDATNWKNYADYIYPMSEMEGD